MLLWLVLACLLPGILGVVVLFSREYLNGRAQLEGDMIATARAMVQSVDSQLFRAKTVGQVLVTSSALIPHDLEGFHRRARDVIATTNVGMNVVLSDENGQQLVNTLRKFGEPLPQHGDPEVLGRVFETGQPVISEIYIGGVLRKPVLSIDLPVVLAGKVAYVLSIGLLPNDFNAILAAQNFPTRLGRSNIRPHGHHRRAHSRSGKVRRPEGNGRVHPAHQRIPGRLNEDHYP